MRPRILVVSHAADLTGAPRVALEIVAALGTEWERVVVLRRRGAREEAFRRTADRVAVEPLHRICRLLRHFDALRGLEAVLSRIIAWIELVRLDPDVVYLNTSEAGGYVQPARRRGLRVILHLHEPRDAIVRILGPHRVEEMLPSVRLVAPSEHARGEISVLTGVPVADIQVLPTTIDAESLGAVARRSPPAGLTIGVLGSPTIPKGVDLWVEIAAVIAPRLPEARLVWVGGDPPARVAARVRSLGLDGRLAFLPPTTDPLAAMREFSILVLPSRAETSGLVVQEGMALGLPIVSFRLPAVADHLGETGVLVAREDVDQMADAIVELAQNPGRRRQLGESARRRAVERFSLEPFRRTVRDLVAQVQDDPTRT